ncbi:MAG: hypothetical protein IT269_06020 [Saprospiraceae bacterium]|nr:hypothetical protein [Saprospiraceae bacterium]
MKYRLLFLLLCTLTFALSCNKDDETVPGFEMPYQADFTIPAGIGALDAHHFQFKNLPTRYSELLTQYNKADADVKGIKTLKAGIGGIFGDANLSFIQQVSIRVYNEDDPNDYIEVAYRDVTPLDPGNELPLLPSLANCKRLMTGTRFSMDVVLWLRQTTQTDSDVRISLILNAQY